MLSQDDSDSDDEVPQAKRKKQVLVANHMLVLQNNGHRFCGWIGVGNKYSFP